MGCRHVPSQTQSLVFARCPIDMRMRLNSLFLLLVIVANRPICLITLFAVNDMVCFLFQDKSIIDIISDPDGKCVT